MLESLSFNVEKGKTRFQSM